MISTASSKYFEGLLFILVRRPYQIGDGIHVSNIEVDTSFTGSAWWTVENVTLFTTSVIFSFTGERATLSNGSLANSRIINSSRSPKASLYVLLKFPVDIAYEKLQVFNKALEEFFKNRPREWLTFSSFRATRM
jgi:small-conductance mechanosensitive channel